MRTWYVSHDIFERGLPCCIVGPHVVCVLHDWQPFVPIALRAVRVDLKELFDPLVTSFRLSICLWVIGRADVLLDVQDST